MALFAIYLISTGFLVGQIPSAYDKINLHRCMREQVELYVDICAESSIGYEKMNGSDAHEEGVKCAVESIQICMEAK